MPAGRGLVNLSSPIKCQRNGMSKKRLTGKGREPGLPGENDKITKCESKQHATLGASSTDPLKPSQPTYPRHRRSLVRLRHHPGDTSGSNGNSLKSGLILISNRLPCARRACANAQRSEAELSQRPQAVAPPPPEGKLEIHLKSPTCRASSAIIFLLFDRESEVHHKADRSLNRDSSRGFTTKAD